MTPDAEPPTPTQPRWRWLLSADPLTRTRTTMSGLALVLTLCCVAVLLWLAAQEEAPWPWVACWGLVTLGGQLAAVCAIRSGWTHLLADPALTMAQILWALTSISVGYVVAAEVRDTLPGMVAMVLLFGSLGLGLKEIIWVCLYAFMVTGAAMALTPYLLHQPVTAVDVAHAMMLAVVVVACMAVSLRLHALRDKLQRQRKALARALEEHRVLASRDALTGALNRRSMLELLEIEQHRCERGLHRMALAVLDIDHFKRINDRFGHPVGDRALQVFVHTVRHAVRGGDVLARWGGEEFVLLLSDVGGDAAQKLLERITDAVSQAVVPDAPPGLRMTVSTGLTIHLPGEAIDATLERADQALYRAKHQGRNCVVLAPACAPTPAAPSLAPAALTGAVTATALATSTELA